MIYCTFAINRQSNDCKILQTMSELCKTKLSNTRGRAHTHTHKSKRTLPCVLVFDRYTYMYSSETQHHGPKSLVLCCQQQAEVNGSEKKKEINIWRTMQHIVYVSCAHISDRPHYQETLTKTSAHVLLGHRVSVCQYKPLTLQRMTGVTWGHCLPYNGAVIWGSTRPEWSYGYMTDELDWKRSDLALALMWGSVCCLSAGVLLQCRWVKVRSMLMDAKIYCLAL